MTSRKQGTTPQQSALTFNLRNKPRTWLSVFGKEPAAIKRRELTADSSPAVLFPCRVSTSVQDTKKLRADFFAQAKGTLPAILKGLGLRPYNMRLVVGSAQAGFTKAGVHKCWDKPIRFDFKHADVIVTLGEAGFAANLLTWRYGLAFLPLETPVVFHYDETTFWVTSREELLQYVSSSSPSWEETMRRLDHLFFHLVLVCANGDVRQMASTMDGELHRYQELTKTGPKASRYFVQDDAVYKPGRIGLKCKLCGRILWPRYLWQLMLHLKGAHWAGPQPWDDRKQYTQIMRAIVWANAQLRMIDSPLYVEDSVAECRRRPDCTAAWTPDYRRQVKVDGPPFFEPVDPESSAIPFGTSSVGTPSDSCSSLWNDGKYLAFLPGTWLRRVGICVGERLL